VSARESYPSKARRGNRINPSNAPTTSAFSCPEWAEEREQPEVSEKVSIFRKQLKAYSVKHTVFSMLCAVHVA
jgi:hypothetical protein